MSGRQDVAFDVLRMLNEAGDLHQAIQGVLAILKDATGCEAAGLRVKSEDDFPYFSETGFPPGFFLMENSLLVRDSAGGVCRGDDGKPSLECTCGLVLSGKTDPASPLFTPYGSFWTNDSPQLLSLTPEQDPRLHPRNTCIHEGYCSVALIPIRAKEGIAGLLHLNGKAKGCFSPESIAMLEDVASHIGEALLRKEAEAEVRTGRELFQKAFNLAPTLMTLTHAATGQIVQANDQFCAVSGYAREELIGKTTLELGWITPDERNGILRELLE